MSLLEFLEDIITGNVSHAVERLKDWWRGQPSWFKKGVSDLGEHASDFLGTAAVIGYNAAETSDKKGLDKIPVAVDAAKNYMGDKYDDALKGTLVSLIQLYWQGQQ